MQPWAATQSAHQAPAPYGYPSNTAYTSVPVRQSFNSFVPPPPPPGFPGYATPSIAAPLPVTAMPQNPPQPSAAQAPAKVVWSQSVRDYVSRAFLPENDDPTIRRPDVEAKLKEVIKSATESGSLDYLDWDSMPPPQQLIRQDRAKASPQTVINPKKRKSTENASEANSQPPWATTNSSSLASRISAPESKKSSKSHDDAANKRKRRFENEYKAYRSPSPPAPASGPVIGTCETLEKKYLRLTAAPVPAKVRPEHILRQTLDLLKKKWRKDANYSYICDQFKSMRQDLTVQHIKNEFTVHVYEIHARIALEKGDIGEYNQCQTQLRTLYQLGLKGNSIEFKAYRILYFIHTANRSGLNDAIADLTSAEKTERPIKHALDVRSALALGNYHRFFQLYMDTPNMGAYLMDMFIVRERLGALCNICKAYKPSVKLRFITEELGFESDGDAAQFIIDYQGQHLLEDGADSIVFMTGKAGGLFEGPRNAAFRKVDIKGQI